MLKADKNDGVEASGFNYNKLSQPRDARKALINLLQNAHAGEKAAANAYYGHAFSLFVRDKKEQEEIFQIYKDELHHRSRLFEMLTDLKAKPRFFRELGMYLIGGVICVLSYFGTWFIPMYGAGKLERSNVGEYEVAARLAFLAGEKAIIDELLLFAEVEWDHELYFKEKVQSHFLSKWISLWPEIHKREFIRSSFEEFRKSGTSFNVPFDR